MKAEEALKFLSSVDCIHSGGCLIAALVFYRNEKRARRTKNFQIVCLSDYKSEYINNRRRIEDNSRQADSTAHFGWTYDGGLTIWDCKGEVKKNYNYPLVVPKHLTEEFSLEAINEGNWNFMFDRDTNVPKMAEFFSLDLSDIKTGVDFW